MILSHPFVNEPDDKAEAPLCTQKSSPWQVSGDSQEFCEAVLSVLSTLCFQVNASRYLSFKLNTF